MRPGSKGFTLGKEENITKPRIDVIGGSNDKGREYLYREDPFSGKR
jgi:hypothetical protein